MCKFATKKSITLQADLRLAEAQPCFPGFFSPPSCVLSPKHSLLQQKRPHANGRRGWFCVLIVWTRPCRKIFQCVAIQGSSSRVTLFIVSRFFSNKSKCGHLLFDLFSIKNSTNSLYFILSAPVIIANIHLVQNECFTTR